MLRSEVGRRTGIRLTPTLEFIADAVPENAAHIEDLLRGGARAATHEVAALAAIGAATRATPTRTGSRPTTRRGARSEDDGRSGDSETAREPRAAAAREPTVERPSGLVVVDKPAGLDLARRRRPGPAAGRHPQVGHAGTLDPMATGVLVLGVERATRLLTYLVGADKDVHRHDPARRRPR